MAAINNRGIEILRMWFEKQITACHQDPKIYDFDAHLDRSLTYHENKNFFENVVTSICGPKPLTRRQAIAEELRREKEINACPGCGTGFNASKKLGSTAEEQLASHKQYCRSLGRIVEKPMPEEDEYYKYQVRKREAYEEEGMFE